MTYSDDLGEFTLELFRKHGDEIRLHQDTVLGYGDGIGRSFHVISNKNGAWLHGSEYGYFSYEELYHNGGTIYHCQLPDGKLKSRWFLSDAQADGEEIPFVKTVYSTVIEARDMDGDLIDSVMMTRHRTLDDARERVEMYARPSDDDKNIPDVSTALGLMNEWALVNREIIYFDITILVEHFVNRERTEFCYEETECSVLSANHIF